MGFTQLHHRLLTHVMSVAPDHRTSCAYLYICRIQISSLSPPFIPSSLPRSLFPDLRNLVWNFPRTTFAVLNGEEKRISFTCPFACHYSKRLRESTRQSCGSQRLDACQCAKGACIVLRHINTCDIWKSFWFSRCSGGRRLVLSERVLIM